MSIFNSTDQARLVFTELFQILLNDGHFRSQLDEMKLNLHLIQTKPDFELFISADGVVDGAPQQPAVLRMKMSCDTAHDLWLGKLLMPLAVATGRVRIKGPVAKVLEMVPILRPAFDQYSDVANRHGVPT